MTRRLLPLAFAAALLTGCEAPPEAATPPTRVEMRTIENTPPRVAPVDPPPVLEEQALPTRATVPPPARGPEPTPEEEMKAKTNLPFAPAIAMDPVDGSKVAITAETPVYSYEGRWYYFSSEANRRAFRAEPKRYLEGRLATY